MWLSLFLAAVDDKVSSLSFAGPPFAGRLSAEGGCPSVEPRLALCFPGPHVRFYGSVRVCGWLVVLGSTPRAERFALGLLAAWMKLGFRRVSAEVGRHCCPRVPTCLWRSVKQVAMDG